MLTRLLLFSISCYQRYISPLKGPTCRYYPTCSEYARQAVVIHGPLKGVILAIWRVLRCNPFSPGGHDPVPQNGLLEPRRFKRCHT
ncbi:MAG TPA: membrane protein insertion efficiency factor YidD [Firmicutes bacterium]|nr:membrane protein insertion efficiency factor YidD [Bacillota bacterium]